MKNLPRGLTFDEKRQQFRIQFISRHTSVGRSYREWLPKTTTRRQAEAYLAKLSEDDRFLQLTWPNEREQEIAPEKTYSVGEFARDIYLPHAKSRNKPKTVRFKEQRLLSLAAHFWDTPLDGVLATQIVQFQATQKERGLSSRTINADTQTLGHLLALANELGYLKTPPPKMPRLKETDRKERGALSVEEAQEAIDRAYQASQVWGTLALFLLHTGARWTETRELLWESVDLARRVVHLKAQNAKQDRDREIPIHPDLLGALSNLPKIGGWVFMRTYRGKVQQMPEDPRTTSHLYAWGAFGAHTWRHTFATWKLRAGVPIALVSRWLGHASIQLTVDLYGHIDGGEHHEEMTRGAIVSIKEREACRGKESDSEQR